MCGSFRKAVMQMIDITPRDPVDEERSMMYLAGYNPMECKVVYRLNGIMVIIERDGSFHRIDERTHKEVP